MLELIKPSYSAVKSVNGKIGIVELTAEDIGMEGMATEEFVLTKIAEAQLAESDVDLSGYYTKSETDKKIDEKIAAIEIPETDLTNYATKSYVQTQISLSEPDLTSYATKDYVAKEILAAQLDQSEVDLSSYYTKAEVDAAIAEDLKPYALKTEIPSTAGLASESYVANAVKDMATTTYVDAQIDAIEFPKTDLSNYYTKSETNAQIAANVPDMTLYATKTYVDNEIDKVEAGGGVDLTGYYTKTEVDALIPEVPTKVSAFTNDLGYQTAEDVQGLIPEIPADISYFANDVGYVTNDEMSAAITEALNAIGVAEEGAY